MSTCKNTENHVLNGLSRQWDDSGRGLVLEMFHIERGPDFTVEDSTAELYLPKTLWPLRFN